MNEIKMSDPHRRKWFTGWRSEPKLYITELLCPHQQSLDLYNYFTKLGTWCGMSLCGSHQVLVCFNYSTFSLTRIWQYPNSPPPPDRRLFGAVPLYVPFFPFMKRKLMNCSALKPKKRREWERLLNYTLLFSAVWKPSRRSREEVHHRLIAYLWRYQLR